jgi:hypothetical protein
MCCCCRTYLLLQLPVEAWPMFMICCPPVPELEGKRVVVMQHVWLGDPAAGEQWFKQEWSAIAEPIMSSNKPLDWLAIQ